MAREAGKEEEKEEPELRSGETATTVAKEVIQRRNAQNWGKGSRGTATYAEKKGIKQSNVPRR